MKKLPMGPLYYEFSRHNEPRLQITPGETVLVEAEDAFSGQIRTNDDRRDKTKKPYGNPQTGPIWIEGAEPGDALAVKIEEIFQVSVNVRPEPQIPDSLPNGWAMTVRTVCMSVPSVMGRSTGAMTSPFLIPLCSVVLGLHRIPAYRQQDQRGPTVGIWTSSRPVPVIPFTCRCLYQVGICIWVMRTLRWGTANYPLPGWKCRQRRTITVDLIKGKNLPGPRIESPTEIMTVATGCPMERSTAQAYAWLILWMEEEFGWDRWKAYDILTHVGQISVGYYQIGTVAAKIAKRYL